MFSNIGQVTGTASVAMMPLIAIGFVSLPIVKPINTRFHRGSELTVSH